MVKALKRFGKSLALALAVMAVITIAVAMFFGAVLLVIKLSAVVGPVAAVVFTLLTVFTAFIYPNME